MGLGKTFIASEKANTLNKQVLVICQKSKIKDWEQHFSSYYKLTVTVINYDKVWRRPEYLEWTNFTLILDESSLIKNEAAKQRFFRWRLVLGHAPVSGD